MSLQPDAPASAPLRAQAQDQLQRYLSRFPDEAPGLAALRRQLAEPGDAFARQNMVGHITTSALVWDAASDALLMIHHQALDRWLQPGGHHEGQDGLLASAAREAREETGVGALTPWPWAGAAELPLDIDTHAIPARPAKGESAHVHHDFIYLFSASADTPLAPQWAEVKGARWMPRAEFAALPEARFARLAGKLQGLR
ncbi:MAG: NUDIX hydrolase [Roseateles depolymerans]|uniref:NUDIX hydrolase n=1 Tax=Roseateles depolymerans TaxID=76731 RepID=A0A2W5DLW7_9BURK|nr:MAG: NUDIX hydrolase [Roseateles depolymerans]